MSIICPHCNVENEDASEFCRECGKALPSAAPTGPRVVTGSAIASTSLGQNVQEKELKKKCRQASIALFAAAVLQGITGIALYAFLKNEPNVDMQKLQILVGVVVGIGVVFAVLGFWARVNPLPASIVGLVLYVTLHAIDAVADPSALLRGWIIKVIVVVALINAIQAGITYRQLKAKMPSQD
ncbi:MAG: hypothetical protein JXA11_09390 [Phycisphaerae bacterium]|nr:hypothetical protein [Phycisphaerae bacterium]